MSTQQNKAVFRRLMEECFNKGNLDLVPELVAVGYVSHTDGLRGPAEFREFIAQYRNAFPDLHFTIEDQIAEGDKVMIRWTARGTHRGDLPGISPTGNSAVVTGMNVGRFVDGQLVEEWNNWDRLGMLEQLGALPAAAEALA